MGGLEVFPAYLLDKDKENEFIIALAGLPILERRKKELLVQWCKYVGAILTEDMVKAVLGDKYGQI